jgi:hypothetical protein
MGSYLLAAVADIKSRFKNLDLLLGNNRPPQPAQQFIRFPTEHGPRDDFQSSPMMFHDDPRFRWSVDQKKKQAE